jgi:hypothetical protein
MTLEELERMLPNGLHDATLRALTRDFKNEALALEVSILVGVPDDPPEERDLYRDALISFTGVKVFTIDPPDAASAFQTAGNLSFHIDQCGLGASTSELERSLGESLTTYSIYVLDWESEMKLTAADIIFGWA